MKVIAYDKICPATEVLNLKDIKISTVLPEEDNRIILTGSLIVDSLKLEMPNEYSRITFDPIVEVTIDTTMWVIENVTTKLDTLKLFQINNFYKMYTIKKSY